MVCHPRLPLIAGLDFGREAVYVWDASDLRTLGVVEAASPSDGRGRGPAVAWHPEDPVLLIADGGPVRCWTPAGVSELTKFPTGYRNVAFGPDARTVWAIPTVTDGDPWECSDVVDLESGACGKGPGWDTGVAAHPAGGLVLTLRSNQGATLGIFARAGDGHTVAPRVLRRALILDVDGYETPIFSPDGRYLAVRGNAYVNTLDVFEFPSLDNVLSTTLGEPSPGYPYPQDWLDRMRAWSRHNIAFGTRPGVLWIGTPTGTLVEADLGNQRSLAHDIPSGAAVTALAATASGDLVVADATGELVRLAASADRAVASPAAVTDFLAGTSDVDADADLESQLVLTDGARTWEPGDLETVDTATDSDPTWLRIQVQMNHAR
ncbi:hypothetical protein NRB56_62160 [Nocardia sp. RB56]|uniref:WD40 repeat domain-containing protein n=1 Tax=Nocardia aurantia TaxID=2585199 RepID=A0A7K0E0J0_9NOCA|nr:hypothetical protein [Nocardia aurantia]